MKPRYRVARVLSPDELVWWLPDNKNIFATEKHMRGGKDSPLWESVIRPGEITWGVKSWRRHVRCDVGADEAAAFCVSNVESVKIIPGAKPKQGPIATMLDETFSPYVLSEPIITIYTGAIVCVAIGEHFASRPEIWNSRAATIVIALAAFPAGFFLLGLLVLCGLLLIRLVALAIEAIRRV